MDKKIISLGLVVGALSGSLVVLLMPHLNNIKIGPWSDPLPYTYGLVYGIVTAFFFAYFSKKIKAVFSIPLWIIISGISYYLGVMTTLSTSFISFEYLPFFFGGLSGSFVLLIGYHFIFSKINYKLWFLTLLVAGLLAAVMAKITGFGSDEKNFLANLLFYTSWQTLVTGLLASSISEFPTNTKSSGDLKSKLNS